LEKVKELPQEMISAAQQNLN